MDARITRVEGRVKKMETVLTGQVAPALRRVIDEQRHARKSRLRMHENDEQIAAMLKDHSTKFETLTNNFECLGTHVANINTRQDEFEGMVTREIVEPLKPATEIFADIGRIYPVAKKWGRRGTKCVIWLGGIGGAVWGIYQGGKVFGIWA